MKRRRTFTMLLAGLALAPLAGMPTAPATAQAVTEPAQEIILSIGKGQLITVPGSMTDVFVANEGIADVQVKSRRQLYVMGRGGGETTIYANNAAGDIIWSANVRVGSNIDSIDQMLALAMPEARIAVSTMGSNTVLLTGAVAAPEDVAEAQRLVEAFTGDSVNVISRLKMATPLQVNLQVKFAEVSRSLVRAIGGNLQTIDTSSGFRFGIGNGRVITNQFNTGGPLAIGPGATAVAGELADGTEVPGTAIRTNGSGTTIGALTRFLGLDLLGALDLAERQGLVTTLSQPNLTALSGETADFLAGGEFPIPMSQGFGATSISFRRFGVSLAYTPTVLANGRISIRVRPEVSELSNQGAIVVDGFNIPGLTIRRAETTVELGSGQSFMIAGLMSSSSQSTINKAPGAGDIPIIGNLFRSTNFQKGETELVIVVTPYLVKPVNGNEIKLPTDGYRSPNLLQQHILYKDNDGVSGASRPMPRAAGEADTGPGVSYTGQGPVAPGKNDERKVERRAEALKPGFSFGTEGE
ncbi:type II and III secretion system protein family protein [Qipengyuania atrilutea]|uniref:Type II and III secretion system protein family protein n=1 Tax=Qipengyuania atrilutea TaxID=2744473 RepID=A0A850H5L9_9SPHN|nr:type II and III secretion system protein family protein [Actirhodobacter atriluteus]NVD45462.1 type II and III secretion system protein family protein [Actirhodobacter atriluteus]